MSMSTVAPQQISPMILTYLVESHCLRKQTWVSEHELVSRIATFIAIVSEKQSVAMPAQAKLAYVETINKFCGTILIVIDQLLENNYIQKMEMGDVFLSSRSIKNHYRANADHPYIEHFTGHLGLALKYVSHPSYSVDGSLLETMKKLRIDEHNPLIPSLEAPVGAGAGAGAGAGTTRLKASGEALPAITHVFACKSEDQDIWYNIYRHEGGRMTCTCPNFQYVRSKTSEPCKHIMSLPSAFEGDDDYEKIAEYNLDEHEPRKLFTKQVDSELFTQRTQFVGRFAYRDLEVVEDEDA